MIESRYWKKDLLKHAKRLSPVKSPPRWSEKLIVNFEKELIISFFMVRKLFETHKVSSKSKKYQARIFECPAIRKVTYLNDIIIEENYDLGKEKSITRNIVFIANQLIHSGTIFAYREKDRNWGGVYVCSDYERKNSIFRIPISEIKKIFHIVGNDDPTTLKMTYDHKKDDYVITAD